MEPPQQSALPYTLKKVDRGNSKSGHTWKRPSLGKENAPPVKPKSSLSASQADQVIRDMKANANKTLINLRSTIGNLSQKLRRSTRKMSSTSMQPYEELDNHHTPVKLYSPFGFTTPSPHKNVLKMQTRRQLTPKRFTFVSPTGKFKKDVEDLSNGIRELHTVARSLPERKCRKQQ